MQDHVLTMFTWEFFSNGKESTIIDRGRVSQGPRKQSLSGWAPSTNER